VDVAASVDLGNPHGWKPEAADVAIGHRLVDHECNVVAAVRQGDDLWLVPHVAQPLTVRQTALLSPGEQMPECRFCCTLAVGIEHPQIGDGACGKVAHARLEPIRIGVVVQHLDLGRDVLCAQQAVEVSSAGIAEGVQIEPPRRLAEVLLEAAREIGRGRKAAVQRHVGQGPPWRVGHQVKGALKSQPHHELVRRLTHERLEDAVEVKGRKAGRFGHATQRPRLSKVSHDRVDCAVDPGDVVGRGGSQDSASRACGLRAS